MYAVKANRQYTITEAEKEQYQAAGYDIVDEAGRVQAHGAGKTVPYAKYQEALDRIRVLEAQRAGKEELERLTVEELRRMAAEKGIELDGGARKPEVVEALLAAGEASCM